MELFVAKNKRQQYSVWFVFFIILIGLNLTLVDKNFIRLFDETGYLEAGTKLQLKKDGALYTLWYWVISCFVSDNISLYFTNFRVLTIIGSVLFLVIAQKRGNLYQGFVFSVLSAICIASPSIWPYITRLHLILSLIIILLFNQKKFKSYFLCTFLSFIMIYLRPESIVSFYSLIIVFTVLLFLKKQTSLLIPYISLSILLIGGSILYSPLSKRSFFAFQQHFVLGLQQQVSIDSPDPWNYTEDIFYTYFDQTNVHSLVDVIIHQPVLMVEHVMRNVKQFSKYVGIPYEYGIYPLLFGLLLILTTIIWKRTWFYQYLLKDKFIVLLIMLCLILPNIISSILIYPRLHYLLSPLILVLLGGHIVIKTPNFIRLTILTVAISFATLLYIKAPSNAQYQRPDIKDIVTVIDQITKVNELKNIRVLNNLGNINIYTKDQLDHFHISQIKTGTIQEFCKTNGIQLLIITPNMYQESKYNTSQDLDIVIKTLCHKGWKRIKQEGTYFELILHNTLQIPSQRKKWK